MNYYLGYPFIDPSEYLIWFSLECCLQEEMRDTEYNAPPVEQKSRPPVKDERQPKEAI
jgi:hypothetical protein